MIVKLNLSTLKQVQKLRLAPKVHKWEENNNKRWENSKSNKKEKDLKEI